MKINKIRVLQVVALLLACFALLGHELIGLSSDHEDCREAMCLSCNLHSEDEAGATSIRLVQAFEALSFTLSPIFSPRLPPSLRFPSELIRAPPLS